MCGIGGVLMFPKSSRSSWEMECIREIVSNIALANQSRGRDATGLVAFNKESAKIFKAPQKASQFVTTKTYSDFVGGQISSETYSVLIHTRAGTQGTEFNNNNNHPIESHKFVGVHNGMIYNDDELFKKEKLFRLAEVDSEVIFRMHDKYGGTIDGIKRVAEKLEGGFTYSFAPKEHRNLLYLVRNSNPVTMVFVPLFNIAIFASEKRFLLTAIEEINGFYGMEILTEEDCHWVEPKTKTIMVFDMKLDTPIDQMNQVGLPFSPSYAYDDYDWYEDKVYGWRLTSRSRYTYNESNKEEAPENNDLEELLNFLSDENAGLLLDVIRNQKDLSWNEGWSAGRGSLDDEMKYSRSLAFEEGVKKGREEGIKEGKMALIEQAENIFSAGDIG